MSFFLNSVGQIELGGPLQVNITFSEWGDWTTEVPLLIYWNKGKCKL